MTETDDLIDLMEGELDQSEVQAMEMLLRHSRNDRQAFLNLTKVREAVEFADPMADLRPDQTSRINSLKFQNNLTNKIMDKVHAIAKANSLTADNSAKFSLDS